jgi:hypothetical protein
MVTFGIKEDPPLVALQEGYSTLLPLVSFSFSLTAAEVTPLRAELYRCNRHSPSLVDVGLGSGFCPNPYHLK